MSLRTLKFLPVVVMIVLLAAPVQAGSIPVANHSFEIPEFNVAENPYGAMSLMPQWTEDDIDPEGLSRNTGIFLNTPADSNDHITNPDGSQLAFFGNYQGNSISQFMASKYQVGRSYKLTVGICVSHTAPPAGNNPLTLAFTYWGGFMPVDIATVQVPPTGLTSTFLDDFTLSLPTIQAGDAWAGRNIGIAIRASGAEGGFWDLDNVRLTEYPLIPEFTGDSFINLADFAKIADEWLSCSETTTDVTGEGCVNTEDLLILAEYWLKNV